jgi:GT2 family glycosyltransferase
LAAVRRVGLPNPDYFIDRGELEYMYRVMKAGYKAFIHRDAVIRHNVGGTSVGPSKPLKVGPIAMTLYEAALLR